MPSQEDPMLERKPQNPLYAAWINMKNRCYNPKAPNFKNYGGRGITVCAEWKDDFLKFREDMLPGYAPGLSIDRIENDGHYCKSNCKWSTSLEQSVNRRSSHFLEHAGEVLTVSEWEKKKGFPPDFIQNRLCRGWDVAEAIETPRKVYKPRQSH